MSQTFYFYDLETSGFNPREARIMQFAGQRTDMDLKPIGKPHNLLIKMTQDVLPDPGAVIVTGITPQKTINDGVSEAEFLKTFHVDIAKPGTIFVGYNNVRFDDEFMRFLNYRNFYDPYEWHWSDGRSRWDLLDLTRMTRALRPNGFMWPVDTEGKSANRLGMLTGMNNIKHTKAHDALSDAQASIAWASLIKKRQPRLFEHLLAMRDKAKVASLVESGKPFVYASGKYSSDNEKTTVATFVTKNLEKGSSVVFDLRYNPTDYAKLSTSNLVEMWQHYCREYPCPHPRLPLKTIKYNRCPAVAPLGVLDQSSQDRLDLPLSKIDSNLKQLIQVKTMFSSKLGEVLKKLDQKQQTKILADELDVDSRLYDGFINNLDKNKFKTIHSAKDIANIKVSFKDERLNQLLPLYKARNFAGSLNNKEAKAWEKHGNQKLLNGGKNSRAATYFNQLAKLKKEPSLSKRDLFLLEELQLWGQSILPMHE